MKTITQKELSKRLGMDFSNLSKVLRGKRKVSTEKAADLEQITAIGLRVWLFGTPVQIQDEIEKIYGKINFRRGRPFKKKEVSL